MKAGDGAALKNDGSNVILKNVSINNTTSSAWGALRLIGGLQYSSSDGSWKEDTVTEVNNAVNPSTLLFVLRKACINMLEISQMLIKISRIQIWAVLLICTVMPLFPSTWRKCLVGNWRRRGVKTANLDSIATYYKSTSIKPVQVN